MEQTAQSETMHFTGDRAEVREQSVRHALGGLLLRLLPWKRSVVP